MLWLLIDPLHMLTIFQYWGYCKYRYCEIWKPTFANAKAAAETCLNSCLLDTICKFINHAWQSMDAYHKGFTGKAADWIVKKQRSHWVVSESARVVMDAVLK